MIRWGNVKRKEGNKTFSSHELPLVPSVIFTFTRGVRFIKALETKLKSVLIFKILVTSTVWIRFYSAL